MGYGGTKTEMERLLKDADALSDTFNLVTDENGDLVYSYADIVTAIHLVQTEMGITGTTAKEAEGTISGSAASMKAAFSNFLTSLASDNLDTKEAFEELKATTSTFLDNLVPKIKAVWDSLGPIGKTIAGITAAIIAVTAAEKIYNTIKTVATALQWALNAAMTANPIGLIIAAIAAVVAAMVLLVKNGDKVKEWISGLWESIKSIFGKIGDFFSGVWNGIKNAFSSVGGWFKDKFTEGKENAQNAWTNVKSFFSNAWDGIKSAFANVGSWFSETFKKGKESAKNSWNNAKDIFGNIWSSIKNVFSNAADVGKNIVTGIRNGISNAWKSLKEWFSGLFDDLIGVAKRILGIASPSKVFKKIGLHTAEGYGIGFEDEFAHVKDDMEDALNFDDASVGINASIRKVGAGSAGGAFGGTSIGTININIDGARYKDEKELAASIAQEIQIMTDRRSAVYA